MTQRVLLIASVLLVLVIGGATLYMGRSRPAPAEPPATSPAAVAAPATPSAPEPAAEVSAAPPVRRRTTTPSREPAPVAPEPAAPTTATLRIDSDVQGAQVFIDRNFVGVTPVTAAEIAPGAHRVNVLATGYESLAENIDVAAGPRDL